MVLNLVTNKKECYEIFLKKFNELEASATSSKHAKSGCCHTLRIGALLDDSGAIRFECMRNSISPQKNSY